MGSSSGGLRQLIWYSSGRHLGSTFLFYSTSQPLLRREDSLSLRLSILELKLSAQSSTSEQYSANSGRFRTVLAWYLNEVTISVHYKHNTWLQERQIMTTVKVALVIDRLYERAGVNQFG